MPEKRQPKHAEYVGTGRGYAASAMSFRQDLADIFEFFIDSVIHITVHNFRLYLFFPLQKHGRRPGHACLIFGDGIDSEFDVLLIAPVATTGSGRQKNHCQVRDKFGRRYIPRLLVHLHFLNTILSPRIAYLNHRRQSLVVGLMAQVAQIQFGRAFVGFGVALQRDACLAGAVVKDELIVGAPL
jgi:hypothetical protein